MTFFKFSVITCSGAETHEVGRRFGAVIGAGSVLSLIGELGAGKTVFVQGVAEGLGVPDRYPVTSPSFTLINEYPGRLRLFHVDLYRLEDPIAFEDIGLFDILTGDGVAAVEWADRMPPGILDDYLQVPITILDDDGRRFGFCAYGQKSVDLLKRFAGFFYEFSGTFA